LKILAITVFGKGKISLRAHAVRMKSWNAG